MLRLDERKVRAELAQAQGWLEDRPNSWATNEAVGRCLRRLGDPTASGYFRRAAALYPPDRRYANDFVRAGNQLRLAGDEVQAREYFEQAAALLRPIAKSDEIAIARLLECEFLLGNYAEVETLADRLRSVSSFSNLRAYPIARLARARRTTDAAMATAAAEELATMIRRERARLSDTGDVGLWDWHEIALEPLAGC